MRIVVLGAGGRTGRVFVQAALAAGHEVTAAVHTLSDTMTPRDRLHVQLCDATDALQLREVVRGQDAVVSLIGHVKGSAADVQSVAMATLLQVMQECSVTRLVSLTGTGVRMPGDHIPLVDRILNWGVAVVDPKRISDGIRHVELIMQSDTEWTILRVLKLQTHKRSAINLKEHGPTRLYVSREDVVAAICAVLEQRLFIRKAPILSK